jgi:hypothetical protein
MMAVSEIGVRKTEYRADLFAVGTAVGASWAWDVLEESHKVEPTVVEPQCGTSRVPRLDVDVCLGV